LPSPTGAPGSATVAFPSVAGRVYTLERCESLGGVWTPVGGQLRVPGTGGTLRLGETGAVATTRFYRVTVDLP
jgi:hypothetical protein